MSFRDDATWWDFAQILTVELVDTSLKKEVAKEQYMHVIATKVLSERILLLLSLFICHFCWDIIYLIIQVPNW